MIMQRTASDELATRMKRLIQEGFVLIPLGKGADGKEAARRVLVLDREEAILAQLEHEALTAKTDSARIRALELLGRHAGMFAERVEVAQVERTAAQIEADVKARLIRLGLVGDSVGA